MSAAVPEVCRGDVWADNDKRSAGRKVRVESVRDGKAICTVIADRDDPRPMRGRYNVPRPAGWSPVGLTTTIAVRRFRPTSTGYRKVS